MKEGKEKSLPKAIPLLAAVFLLGYVFGHLSSSSSYPNSFTFSPPTTTATAAPAETKASQQPQTDPPRPPTPPPHDLFRFRTQCSRPVPRRHVLRTILRNVYNGSSPYVSFPSPETASRLLPTPRRLRGWGSRNPVFRDLILSVKPSVIIELGTFLGASALHMANLSLGTDALILCLDDFRGWPSFQSKFPRDVPRPHHADSMLLQQFMLNVVAAGAAGKIVPMPFSTGSSLAALCEWGVYGDLIEVDAGHDFHSAWADVNMAWAVLRPGGVLFGHDYFTAADDRGVRRAVDLFAKVKGLRVRANGEHWVLSPKPDDRHWVAVK